MQKLLLLILIASALVGLFFAQDYLKQSDTPLSITTPETIEKMIEGLNKDIQNTTTETVEKTEKIIEEIINPPPLIIEPKNPLSFEVPDLTSLGVFVWTNIQRQANSNLGAFTRKSKLDEIAQARLEDMFEKQYFAHDSPAGENAGSIAEDVNYEYIAIGENIARGGFESDQVLVQAWMDSPGHRANILNSKFTEIGIAVGRGNWGDKDTWIGVQIFARPLSACEAIDENLEANIDTNRTLLENLTKKANDIENYLNTLNPQNQVEINDYNDKVREYNDLAAQINLLVNETKQMINLFNKQVNNFNACLQE
jgi:uncharacterized protein YkwD